MKRIEYFCCLVGLAFTGLSCSDNEDTMLPKPEGIVYGTVTDKGGHVYKTLTIGGQTWLAENYRFRPSEATASDVVTYGEVYGGNERAIIEGNDLNAYKNFCKNYSGQRFLLYLREQIHLASEAGRLQSGSMTPVSFVSSQIANYPMPALIPMGKWEDIAEELTAIWEDAINHHFRFDPEYLERFGYLYSYEGALKAVKEGAPEGFHLPTDAEWMMLERSLGMSPDELEGLENWRGCAGSLLKEGEQGIGFNALYGGAAVYALSTQYNSQYVYKNEGAYFWSSDRVFVSDSLSNGIVRNISLYHSGIRRTTSRLTDLAEDVRPSYSVRLVKKERD